jgi:hypothetical protein
MALNCPGMNVDVLPEPTRGKGIGDGSTQGEADKEAEGAAIADAITKAYLQFPKFQCPGQCVSVPIPKIVTASDGTVQAGAVRIPAATGAKHFASIGWARGQLDVLCLEQSAQPEPAVPPVTPGPAQPTITTDQVLKGILRFLEALGETSRKINEK